MENNDEEYIFDERVNHLLDIDLSGFGPEIRDYLDPDNYSRNPQIQEERIWILYDNARKLDDIELVKKLYSYGTIRINSVYEFYDCARKNCINVFKWLYSVGNFDIHIYENDIFKIACDNKYLELAQFLFTIRTETPFDITKQTSFTPKELTTLDTCDIYDSWAKEHRDILIRQKKWEHRRDLTMWRYAWRMQRDYTGM